MTGSRLRWLAAASLLVWGSSSVAAGQFIEDVRISRSGNEATVTIDLACPMRFQSDFAASDGVLLEIRVAPLDDCRQMGLDTGFANERTRPVGGHLANLLEVEYESLGLGENLVMFHFDRPVEYEVRQRGSLRSLELTVKWDPTVAPIASAREAIRESEPDEATKPTVTRERRAPAREPMQIQVREPQAVADYMINLQSTRDAIGAGIAEELSGTADTTLYVSQTEVNGETWNRLRLGFFASEDEARAVLETLIDRFPRAWVGRAEAPEVASASNYRLENGEVYSEGGGVEDRPAETVADTGVANQPLDSDRIATLMQQGKDAMLGEDFEQAVRIYTRVLEAPGPHRQEAQEFLGVAREKNGQLAHARAVYQAYLEEFGSTPEAARVRQRLNGLLVAAQSPRAPLRSVEAPEARRWEFASGVSQYYRHHVSQIDEDRNDFVTFSALLSDFDFSLRRDGDAVDLGARVAMSHFYNLADTNRSIDPNRVSYAYMDLDADRGDWSLRLGRQSLHNWGVLGRFDGAHFSYDWRNGPRLHYTMGFPVESTRYPVRTDREFHGVAVEFEDLVGRWDIGPYVNQQTIDSIDDRQAVGMEARYLDDRRSLTGMLDYDAHYGELNSVLALGTWRFENRMTLTALVDMRMSPLLTTRNALIGQPVATIEEMLLVWTPEEIEQIALDRTARSLTTTFGFAKPIGERFQINADVTATEIDSTVASAGVEALPGIGQQIYYSASFVGSSIFGTGDVSVISLRHGTADTFETSQITWDVRLPIGRKIRLNPRLRYALWDGLDSDRSRDKLSASLRLLMRFANRYRLELELGTDETTRTDSRGEQQLSGYFFDIGYRADF